MIRQMFLAATLATIALLGSAGQKDAFACNRTAGCVMDVIHEGYDMKHDGRAEEAMKAGRENMEAFRALQAAQQKGSARK